MNNRADDCGARRGRSGVKLVVWIIIAILSPFALAIGWFYYETALKQTELTVSQSPDSTYTIRVTEVGEPFFFGPSTVRIKADGKKLERSLSNDGAMLQPENVSVHWESETEARITLYGMEQAPDVILFKAGSRGRFSKQEEAQLDAVQTEIGSFDFLSSKSPDLSRIIELREITMSKGSSPHSTVRIYYGKNGGVLETFQEHVPSGMYTPDNFQIEWISNEEAVVKAVREQDGRTIVEKTYRIKLDE